MTSSLVGSEMCIRDSPNHTPHCPPGCTITCLVCSKKNNFCRADDAQEAVSYTHLTLPTICSV
eukprot:12442150-Prorocentrum_lima.AAC.1